MKRSFILMSLVLGALALSSCNNSEIEKNDNIKGAFTFNVATDTRAAISGMDVVWQAGDKIALGAAMPGDTSTTAKEFTWVSQNTFSADTSYDASATYDFYAVYPSVGGKAFTPSKIQNPNEYSKYITFGGKTITQNGETMDHVMAVAPMYGIAKNASPENLTITMHHAAALLDFEIVNASESQIAVKSFKMETPSNAKFCGTYFLAYDGKIKPSGDSYVYNTSTVNVTNATAIAKNASFHVYMPIAPFTLASGSKVTFTITTTDDRVCTFEEALSSSVSFAAGTVNRQSLSFESGSSVDYSTVAEINATGSYSVRNATVYAVAGKNAVIGDATGNILAYKTSGNFTSSELSDGDVVSLSGNVTLFDGVYEFSDASITKTGTPSLFDRGTAVNYSAQKILDSKTNVVIEYSTFEANFQTKSLLKVDTLSIYPYFENVKDTVGLVGKDVICYGYFIGFKKSSSKFSFIVTDIKPASSDASITLPGTSASFASDEMGSGSIKSVDFSAVNTDVTITCDGGSWLSFSANNSTRHFEFYPLSENTGSTDRTATVTITASAGNQYNKTFTITQNGKVSGDVKTAVLTLSSSSVFGKSPLNDSMGNAWTADCANIGTWNTDYNGQQFGTSKTNVKATFTADFSGKTITSVEIKAAAGNTTPSYSIAVGSSQWKSGSLTKTMTPYSATGNGSGVITITLDQKSAAKAVYLASITVTYTE